MKGKKNPAKFMAGARKRLVQKCPNLTEASHQNRPQNCRKVKKGIQTNRRKEIYLILHPETAAGTAGGKTGGRGGKKNETETVSFSKDTANKTGKTERAIRSHAKIGKELKGVADKLQGTPVEDSQKAACSLEYESQLAIEAKKRKGNRTDLGEKIPQGKKGRSKDKGEAAEHAAIEFLIVAHQTIS